MGAPSFRKPRLLPSRYVPYVDVGRQLFDVHQDTAGPQTTARATALVPHLSTQTTSINPAVLTSPPLKPPRKGRQRKGRQSTALSTGKASRQKKKVSSLRHILNPSTDPETSPASNSPATPTLAWWKTGGPQSVGFTRCDDGGDSHSHEADVGLRPQTPLLTPLTSHLSSPCSHFFDADLGDATLF
jgi:hypothetical protein